jgi:hypothetical protein
MRVIMPAFEKQQLEQQGLVDVDTLLPPADPLKPRRVKRQQPKFVDPAPSYSSSLFPAGTSRLSYVGAVLSVERTCLIPTPALLFWYRLPKLRSFDSCVVQVADWDMVLILPLPALANGTLRATTLIRLLLLLPRLPSRVGSGNALLSACRGSVQRKLCGSDAEHFVVTARWSRG